MAADERIVENRSVAHGLLFAEGLDSATVDALFARMPRENFLRSRPDQIAWQALALRDAGGAATVVSARLLSRHGGGCEVLVCTPDRDGLFAAIVITLDRLGLAIQQARALDGPALDGHGSTIFDTFHVLPVDPANPPSTGQIETSLRRALTGDLDRLLPSRRTQPRHLKHFRISPRVGLETTVDGRHTQLSLICTDRPGLLADVSHVLRCQRVRVQDARIATFGERAEDLFLIASADDTALDDAQCAALREALREALDGPPKG